MKKVVIIGGMAAGCKAAARLKRIDPKYDVTIVEKRGFVSYGACGMPMFASGDVDDFFDLARTPFGIVRDVDYFSSVKDVKVMINTEAIGIDTNEKNISTKNLLSEEINSLEYDYLVISTGAHPAQAPFPIPVSENISTFHNPMDAKKFREKAQKGAIGNAVIVGGGYIGCELAEALVSLWGIETTLIERENRLLPICLDLELSPVLEKCFSKNDIQLKLETSVERVETNDENGLVVFLDSGEKIETDYLFLCLGVKPETSIAVQAGIELGKYGGIIVDNQLRTNKDNIWAGGDCIEIISNVTEKPTFMPLGSLANRHGRVIANSIAGIEDSFIGASGAVSMKVFAMITASAGISENTAISLGYDADSVTGSWFDRPDYHPDHKTLFGKLVYDKRDKRILGVQMIGEGEVTRYIDTVSEMIKNKADIYSLIDAEHCYMPAHSSPMSPLNSLGAMAYSQIFDGIRCLKCTEIKAFAGSIIDVREKSEIDANPYIGDVITIPLKGFRKDVQVLDKEKPVLIVCQKGPRSFEVAKYMKNFGFKDVSYLGGGVDLHQLIF